MGHRLVVIGLGTEDVGQDRNINERGEQGHDIAGEHGIALGKRSDSVYRTKERKKGNQIGEYSLATCAVNGEVTGLLLGSYEPGDKRAGKAEDG